MSGGPYNYSYIFKYIIIGEYVGVCMQGSEGVNMQEVKVWYTGSNLGVPICWFYNSCGFGFMSYSSITTCLITQLTSDTHIYSGTSNPDTLVIRVFPRCPAFRG